MVVDARLLTTVSSSGEPEAVATLTDSITNEGKEAKTVNYSAILDAYLKLHEKRIPSTLDQLLCLLGQK